MEDFCPIPSWGNNFNPSWAICSGRLQTPPHSLLGLPQTLLSTFEGFPALTVHFSSCPHVSTRTGSGLWLGHFRTKNLVSIHSCVDLFVCFGSLPCCMTHFGIIWGTDGLTFSCGIFWYKAEFVILSVPTKNQGPKVAKLPPASSDGAVTVLDSCYEVLIGERSICFLSGITPT